METQFPIRFVPSESGIRNVAISQGFGISAARNEERKLNAEDTLLGRVVNTCPSNFGRTDFKWRRVLHRIGGATGPRKNRNRDADPFVKLPFQRDSLAEAICLLMHSPTICDLAV
jgi:hypothetical protein